MSYEFSDDTCSRCGRWLERCECGHWMTDEELSMAIDGGCQSDAETELPGWAVNLAVAVIFGIGLAFGLIIGYWIGRMS